MASSPEIMDQGANRAEVERLNRKMAGKRGLRAGKRETRGSVPLVGGVNDVADVVHKYRTVALSPPEPAQPDTVSDRLQRKPLKSHSKRRTS